MTIKTPLWAGILAGLLAAGTASAQVTIQLNSVDNTSQLTGYVTQDLIADTDTDWTAAVILIELESGTIYQDINGGNTKPFDYFISLNPSLEFDTYVAGGGYGPSVQGAGGDVGGDEFQFDDEEIDATWNDNTGDDTGGLQIGRFTFSDDAAGTWRLLVTQKDDTQSYPFLGSIVDGVMAEDP